MIKFFYIITIFILSCSPAGPQIPKHQNPVFRTRWTLVHSLKINNTHNSAILEQIASRAEQRLKKQPETEGFGNKDVMEILSYTDLKNCLNNTLDLEKAVTASKKLGTYYTDINAQRGDLVLFHNQYHKNENSAGDNWFTGIAIVTQNKRGHIEAITRTGNKLRHINISPSKPLIYMNNGLKINSFVRIPSPSDPEETQYLAGALYAGYINTSQLWEKCK